MTQRSYYQAHPAFTLVEILVVVAIFAILSTVGIISITSSRNRANLENSIGSMASAIAKIQGYTRAGRSVPDSVGVTSVPRSYGFTVDKINYQVGFKLFADFPIDPIVPHCYANAADINTYCNGYFLFPNKNDAIVEDSIFGNNVEVFDVQIAIGADPSFSVDRVDLVYVIPTSETILYYLDPMTSIMTRSSDSNDVAVTVKLKNTATNNIGDVVIRGGAIGGNVRYMLE